MNPTVKTPKSAYVTLAAGIALGAACMGTVYTGATVTKAYAQQNFRPRLISATNSESMTELRNLDVSFANLADFVGPAVVDIKAVRESRPDASGKRTPVAGGEGSGFVFRPDGYIITNDHVVGDFDKVTVTLRDGREYPGKVTRAHDSDIALVKIDANNLPTLSFADSGKVRPGEFSMAVGAPFGLENSVTIGHVSALHRADEVIEGRIYPDLIQTDTAINMGNSGGPLVNIDGQVIGINTAIYSPSGTSAGIGFAIPANQARFIADMLINKGTVTRAYMGLQPETVKEYRRDELKIDGGAEVVDVPSDGPAAMAGLKKGDIILKVNDQPINSSTDLRNSMLVNAPGSTVTVEYLRDGKRQTTQVKLATPPKLPQPQQEQQFEEIPQGQNPFSHGFNFPKGFGFDFQNPFDDGSGAAPQLDPPAPQLNDGKPHLGVSVGNVTDEMRTQFGIPADVKGAVVESVTAGSAAARIGMRLGDVVQQLGDRPITSSADLVQAMQNVKSGQQLRIKFTHYGNGSVSTVDAKVTF